jgi:hypothetical protein
MSPLRSRVGLERMAALLTTSRHIADRSSGCIGPRKSARDASAKRYPPTRRSRHVDDRTEVATNAVAVAFARIVAERYPGTVWLPVKRSGGHDGLVVPAGKVFRLLPAPANMDASGGIGDSAASAACERAPHEHGANPGA